MKKLYIIMMALVVVMSSYALAVDGPTLTSPADGATGQPLNPTLTWNAISDQVHVQYWPTSNPSSITTVDLGKNVGSYQILSGLQYNTEYEWHVRGRKGNDPTTEWSTTWSFTTICQPLTFYRDEDADGYGDPEQTTTACSAPAGYVSNDDDCDDGDDSIYLGATEVCDGEDNDCDDVRDDNIAPVASQNQDGLCSGNEDTCVEGQWVTGPYTPVTEVCTDEADNDCDGTVNDGCNGGGNGGGGDIGVPEYSTMTLGLAVIVGGIGLAMLRRK